MRIGEGGIKIAEYGMTNETATFHAARSEASPFDDETLRCAQGDTTIDIRHLS
jgi:hypothetical protein